MDYMIMPENRPFFTYPEHIHGYWEILFQLEGSGTAVFDGENYAFRPGTVFCIRPGVAHAKRVDEGMAPSVDGSILVRECCFEDSPEKVLVFQDDAGGAFRSLYSLASRFAADRPAGVYADRYLHSLIAAMQDLLCCWKDMDRVPREVARIRRLIHDHAADPDFDLGAAVSSGSYSPNHLRALFRKEFGVSPQRYLGRTRIRMAIELLMGQDPPLAVSEIALRCGFRDPYYFSRVFRLFTGVSPLRYRREGHGLDPDRLASDFNDWTRG